MGLTLLKAAEILDLNIKDADPKMPPDVKESLLLARDALNRIQYGRVSQVMWAQKLLRTEMQGPQ